MTIPDPQGRSHRAGGRLHAGPDRADDHLLWFAQVTAWPLERIAHGRLDSRGRTLPVLAGVTGRWPSGIAGVQYVAGPGPQMYLVPDARDPELLAVGVRSFAGCGSEPIRSMSELAGRLGILLFTSNLGNGAPDGASAPSEKFGVAVVNGDRDTGRRRLNAAHDIGHLIGGDGYRVDWRIDVPDQEYRESFLDRFARALLLPADAMTRAWSACGSDGFDERAQALVDASLWQVDMSTLGARLRSLKLVDSAAQTRIRGYRPGRADFVELGLVKRDDLEAGSLPALYERAVLKLYRSEDISANRALDLFMGAYDEVDLPALEPVRDDAGWSLL